MHQLLDHHELLGINFNGHCLTNNISIIKKVVQYILNLGHGY